MLEIGTEGRIQILVADKDTALAHKSGELLVFATPAMAALMEQAAWTSVASYLEEGEGTVGTMLQLSHLAPTPVGMTVTCVSRLTGIEGRKLVFALKAYDEVGLIGEGVHERMIITNGRFQIKANKRADNNMQTR